MTAAAGWLRGDRRTGRFPIRWSGASDAGDVADERSERRPRRPVEDRGDRRALHARLRGLRAGGYDDWPET